MKVFTKRIALLLTMSLLLGIANLKAQSWDEVVNNRETWLFGEGSGFTMEDAQKAALRDLTSKISTFVASSFEQINDEKFENGNLDAKTYVNMKLDTYSTATLTNTEHFEKEEGEGWAALRFIRRDEVNRIFEGRKAKVEELLHSGEKAESQYKAGDALKYYYWAFTLLKTMQYPNEVKYKDAEGTEHQLATYLPIKIDEIFDDLRVSVTDRDGDIAELYFTFRGRPVVNLDYSYYNGRNYSNIYNVKDGRGDVELLPNFTPEYLQIRVEYAYRQDAKTYCPEVKDVQEVVKSHTLQKATTTVPMGEVRKEQVVKVVEPIQAATSPGKSALAELTDDAEYRKKADQFIGAIRSKDYHNIDGLFTKNGLEMYNQLLKYGTARIYGQPNYKVYRKGDEVVVRSIPMSFAFNLGARKSIV